ncbi:MAG: hypothetical protein R2762_06630 [Bryobacteraceae bacterium]
MRAHATAWFLRFELGPVQRFIEESRHLAAIAGSSSYLITDLA